MIVVLLVIVFVHRDYALALCVYLKMLQHKLGQLQCLLCSLCVGIIRNPLLSIAVLNENALSTLL